jgi:glucose/mannose-6-phosphate isomerase
VSLLDDERALRAGDPSGMLDAVLGFPGHAREGYGLGRAAPDLPSAEGVANVAFVGMGGSAVSGDVLRALMADRLRVPVVVIRSPELPEWVGPHTLVVASSYSGDTAETLSAFEEAVRRGARIVAVTAGGELGRRASELALGRAVVPGGFQPRAALGYLALATLGALEAAGLLPALHADVEASVTELRAIADRMAPGVPTSINPAKQLAEAIGERGVVVWGADGIGAVAAARWKTQLNENAKVPAWASALPELDHNEVVGWSADRGHGTFLVALRHEGEHPDVAARFPLSVAIAEQAGVRSQEVWARGRSALTRLLSLVLVGDLTSTYLALAREVDPTPVEAITRLKEAIAAT